jgi:hypothetical protein
MKHAGISHLGAVWACFMTMESSVLLVLFHMGVLTLGKACPLVYYGLKYSMT